MTTEYPNTIFYHMPKTGGTWVNTVFRKAKVKGKVIRVNKNDSTHLLCEHAPPTEHKSKKFSFTIMRKPSDWYFSLYNHMEKIHWKTQWLKHLKADSYEEFLDKCVKHYPEGLATEYFKAFKDVDLILSTETLKQDIIPILEMEGIDLKYLETPKVNVNKSVL